MHHTSSIASARRATVAGSARRTRPRILAVAAMLACAGAPVRAEPPPELVKVGVFTVAPYVLAGPDGPQGALIDFFNREIAPRMGVRFQWQRPVTVARLEHSLASGDIQFTPILAHTPERDRSAIQFDTEVHIRFVPCVAVLPEHKLNAIRGPDDLAGMTLGWVQAGALPEFMRAPRIRYDLVGGVDWETTNLGKLRLGRIDGAYFSNCATARYHANRNGMRLKLLPLPVEGAALYAAFAPSAPPDLVRRYHKAAQAAFAAARFEGYLEQSLDGAHP